MSSVSPVALCDSQSRGSAQLNVLVCARRLANTADMVKPIEVSSLNA
jgi:hypothetical protein